MRKVHLMEGRIVTRSGIWIAAAIMATVLQAPAALADETSQILRGYEIIKEIFPKGTKLNFAGTDWALVGLGSYLVNSTGCNDCHTHPNYAVNHNPYLGQPEQINTAEYLAGGRQFGPDPVDGHIVFSANITPDKKNRMPAGLTWDAFREVMQTGLDPYPDYPGRLLQVMPWPLYRWKTDHDLRAMYEYLRVIPHLDDNPAPGP
jgi:hypothetical protein